MDRQEFKQAQRRSWSAGDYRPIGRMLEPAARALVARAGVRAGDRVLDVATGSGTVALAAARAGGIVTGIDLTDAVFDEGYRRAEEAGVGLTLHVGDAEDLPVPDDAFDVVLSGFGAVMAPDHQTVAAELVRACRPGGTIALTAWPEDSRATGLFSALFEELPDPPDFVEPHTAWGDPAHASELLEPHGVRLRFERLALGVAFPSVDAFEATALRNGPMVVGREVLEQLGEWDDAYAAWRASVATHNEADDGTFRMAWDYLVLVGTLQA